MLAPLLAALLAAAEPPPEEAPRAVTLPAATLAPGAAITLRYAVAPGWKVNDRAPRRLRVGARRIKIAPGPAPVTFALEAGEAAAALRIETEYYVCRPEPDAPCYQRAVRFHIPRGAEKDALRQLELVTPAE